MAPLRGGMLTNEAMYQKTWSSFVDGVISKHQQEGDGAEGEGSVRAGRIELRDVMCLEEVLAKLEKAEGGWIDYETRPPAAELAGDDDAETEYSSLCPVANGQLRRDDRYRPRVSEQSPILAETSAYTRRRVHSQQQSMHRAARRAVLVFQLQLCA